MHELGITLEIIDTLSRKLAELQPQAQVKRVVLEIGKLSAVLPDSIRFCFDLCVEGTPIEGASLTIIEPPGLARCKLCCHTFAIESPFSQCPCGNSDLEWLSGNELQIREMEILSTGRHG